MLTARAGAERLIAPRAEPARLRRLSRDRRLSCAACDAPVIFRSGARVTAHFAHRAGSSCPLDADPDTRHETELHLSVKLAVHDWLRAQHPTAQVELEAGIPETGQRADVLLTTGERRVAFEVQYSALSGEAWRKRHAGYARAGVRDLWLLVGAPPDAAVIEPPRGRPGEASLRLALSDLPATVLHETGELWLPFEPAAAGPDGLLPWLARRAGAEAAASPIVVGGVCALAAHHGVASAQGPLRSGAFASLGASTRSAAPEREGDAPPAPASSARRRRAATPGRTRETRFAAPPGLAAPPFADRAFRGSLLVSGRYVIAAPLAGCTLGLDAGGATLLTGPDHAALREEALRREAAARARPR